jgi:hypothetical protein
MDNAGEAREKMASEINNVAVRKQEARSAKSKKAFTLHVQQGVSFTHPILGRFINRRKYLLTSTNMGLDLAI